MPSDTYTLVIADAGVSTPADGSVTTVKIADANVTTAKIADSNVTTAKIATGAVTDVKLATDSVIPAKIQASAVQTAKIADGAVTTAKIADGAVTSSKIAATTITDGNIAAGAAIALSKLATGALPVGITVGTASTCTGNAATATTATNLSGATAFTIPYQTASSATGYIPVGAAGQVLQSSGAAAPTWVTNPTNTVASGGTGITSYTTGDILYASATNVLGKLAASATVGSVLTSSGVGAAPAYSTSPTLTTPVLGAATGTSLAATGAITSSGTAGIGYATGAGGTITQTASKSTGVTLNKICGQITMDSASLAHDTVVSFTLTNSTIAVGDVLILNHVSGGTAGKYLLNAQCGAGSAFISVKNTNATSGALAEAIVIAFIVIKAVIA